MNSEELKVGKLFMASMKDIGYFSLSNGGTYYINNLNDKLDKYDSVYFLLKYLGDNLCEEYYTGKILQISYPINEPEYYITKYAWYNSFWSQDKLHDKWKLFQELDRFILDYPLVIEPQNIMQPSTYELFNNGDKNKVKENLVHAFKNAKILYLKSKNEFINNEYANAYVEYMEYDFNKREVNNKNRKLRRG